MKPLTPAMITALKALHEEQCRSAYPGLSLGTLNALAARGLVAARHPVGSMAFPHTSIVWSMTEKGYAALSDWEASQ
jgi:hypothetical protein